MIRTCSHYLASWLRSPNRKPLIVRGARQVGKTWLVRHLAATEDMDLIEINFERDPQLERLFASSSPHDTMRALEEHVNKRIDLKQSILFLDEIQNAPELIAKLRWFYEEMPQLAVVVAGSLLEFVLGTYPMSMPVGRVSFMYVEPFSFVEFLQALSEDQLVDRIRTWRPGDTINQVTHETLLSRFKQYIVVGGLPASVASWVATGSLADIAVIHKELLTTYQDDFSKYSGRIDPADLTMLFQALPLFLGKKFVYSKAVPDMPLYSAKRALEMLERAQLLTKVTSTAANGVPLGAEAKRSFFKVVLLDVGLTSSQLGLKLMNLESLEELDMVHKGGIAEQVTGQLLKTIVPAYQNELLYYWVRAKKGSDAEIDYVLQYGMHVVPLEVKSGKVGALRSLHQFVKEKDVPYALRVYAGAPLQTTVRTEDADGATIAYQLQSLPFYLLSEIPRLLDGYFNEHVNNA